MILIGSNPFLLYCIFHVKKLKLKQVVYHKKEFPSDKNSILKGKIRNTFILHILTVRGKINCNKAGHCIHSSFPSRLYFLKQEVQ